MGRMNRTLNKFSTYEILFEKESAFKKLYTRNGCLCLPVSSINSAVRYIDSKEKYAALRGLLCNYIIHPYEYHWEWYSVECRDLIGINYYDKPGKNSLLPALIERIPEKTIKLFRKECQRLINILDKSFDKNFRKIEY